uniref:DJ-1_PfpI domain-containing protein n=1 Tax=Panagrellus redivivus TaxID=6233 RepID=A0A7E4WDI9_PANRE
MSKPALIIVFPNAEDSELIIVVDILRRAEIDVTTASLNDEEYITLSKKTIIKPDAKLSDVESKDFGAIIVPGGHGVNDILKNAKLGGLLKKYESEGKIVAAICGAPYIFTFHDVGKGGAITSFPEKRDDIKAAGYEYSEEDVAVSKNVVTSRGPGTAFAFALKLVELLKDKETADKVDRAVVHIQG